MLTYLLVPLPVMLLLLLLLAAVLEDALLALVHDSVQIEAPAGGRCASSCAAAMPEVLLMLLMLASTEPRAVFVIAAMSMVLLVAWLGCILAVWHVGRCGLLCCVLWRQCAAGRGC